VVRRLPGYEATNLEWLLFEQCGVLSWRQAVTELSEAKVRHLLATGRWRSVCRGVIITHGGSVDRDQQLWIAVLAAGRGAVIAGLAAACAGGLRNFRDDRIDVLVPAERQRATVLRRLPPGLPAVVVHRTAAMPEEHLQVGRPMRTTMPRAVVDAAAWAHSDTEARTIAAAACQQRLVEPREILSIVDAMPRTRRRHITMQTAYDAEGGARALSEIDFIRLCRRYELPRPDLQEKRHDAGGRVRFLDAYWRQWRLHAEVDGAHHMDSRHWEADMRRQNDVWIAGDRILRFSAGQVREDQCAVAEQISAALTAAGWRKEQG